MQKEKANYFNESEIDLLQSNWKNSKHPINNPVGYSKIKNHHSCITELSKQKLRNYHLSELLMIIFSEFKRDNSLYQSGKSETTCAFEKYLVNILIKYYPFTTVTHLNWREHLIRNNSDFDTWLNEIFTPDKNRAQWTPAKRQYPKIEPHISDEIIHKICELRFRRIAPLAKICSYIDQIQVEDYRNNEVVILENGEVTGNISGLIYGEKHSLSAYLGQWIVRSFPFKDIKGFYSNGWKEGNPSVYEHYTPMSFFRDLIWVKNLRNRADLIFDFKAEYSKAFTIDQWISILWYRYRTITIHDSEDRKLSSCKEKSRRSDGDIAYINSGISVFGPLSLAWNSIHSIDQLEKQFNELK